MEQRFSKNGDAFQPWGFIFATGIECSYPTITGKDGRTKRKDQLEETFHYKHWKEDLALVRQMGLRYLRYGPPYFKVHTAPGQYDWEFTDLVFAEMQRLEIIPIVDLCHFGVPDWVGDFQNPNWPELFAEFAGAFAKRFPWVQLYTPVNEIYVCAKLSGWNGIWNERKKQNDHAFVTALKHLCKANLLAIREILKVRPDAIFIQSESAEYFHCGSNDPKILKRAQWENDRRFLSLDLLLSVPPCTEIALYLFDHGMTRDEYKWFMSHGLDGRIIVGNDFYERNEQIIMPHGGAAPAGEVFGWGTITRQYYNRYRRPVMHTETNTQDAANAPRWLWKEFFNVLHLRDEGVPVLGFTWYSLVDQVDWHEALAEDVGRVNPVGLFDLQRRPRPVAAAYRELLLQFSSEPLVPRTPIFTFYKGAAPPPPKPESRPKPQHTVEGRALPQRATVTIARTTDENIGEDEIEGLVREALDHLGGMQNFVQPGQTVLIKPNQTMWRLAKDGCTTDPRVVAALARIAREAGAGTVQVGECTSCGQVTREVMRITGMERAARDAGAELVYFDEVEQVEVDVPREKIIKNIPLPKPLLEADVVIACPKLKTHFLDPITGAIKLWVGATRQDVMHRLHRDEVQQTVSDFLTVTRPDLVVMDAIIAGEGNGPIAVHGRFVGCILASDDPVALDVIAGDLAGFDGEKMSFPRAAAERGIGINERSRIDVLGVSVEEAGVHLEPGQIEGWEKTYPVRVIVGEGVTMAGSLGHFKGFADFWQKNHLWGPVIALHGTPTFMIGRAEDTDFEEHLKQGKYFVIDDVAHEKYKRDPRVVFIPGSPVGNEMMPAIMAALGISKIGQATQKAMQLSKKLQAKLVYH